MFRNKQGQYLIVGMSGFQDVMEFEVGREMVETPQR